MNALEDPRVTAQQWYDLFSRYANDIYPNRYTPEKCRELAEQAVEIQRLATAKDSLILVHNYLYPEFHEIAHRTGDSLELSLFARDAASNVSRVDFQSVFFMGATAKIIVGDKMKIFVPDYPEVLGCSLVFDTDYEPIEEWKQQHPDGILITYINSDAYTKSISDFISTSRNTDKIIVHVIKTYPKRKILVLPDRFLGLVMKMRALQQLANDGVYVDPNLIDVYQDACCYVHEQIGERGLELALDNYPDAELMIHPECGCAASCLIKLQRGQIPHGKAYFLSTGQMIKQAKESPVKKFLVATEKGMVYRLRKEAPDKQFIPVSFQAECRYMKSCTFEKLLDSLRRDRLEIVLCDDCCDPKNPYQNDSVIHIQKSVAEKARSGIDKMLSIV